MAQSTILAAAQTAAVATFTVAAGDTTTVGIFCAAGRMPTSAYLTLRKTTPGTPNFVFKLCKGSLQTGVLGTGDYEVVRTVVGCAGKDIGVYKDVN